MSTSLTYLVLCKGVNPRALSCTFVNELTSGAHTLTLPQGTAGYRRTELTKADSKALVGVAKELTSAAASTR